MSRKLITLANLSLLSNWDPKFYNLEKLKFSKNMPTVKFRKITLPTTIDWVNIDDELTYSILGVRTYGVGVYVNRTVLGKTLKMRKYQKSKVNHLFWCKVDTKNGAFGIIDEEFEDTYGSSNMSYLKLDIEKVNINYLQLLFQLPKFTSYMDNMVVGVTNRKYISMQSLLNDVYLPLPKIDIQESLVNKYKKLIEQADKADKDAIMLERNIEKYLFESLGIEEVAHEKKSDSIIEFVNFKNISQWGYDKLGIDFPYIFNIYKEKSLNTYPTIYKSLFRGKSPKYSDKSDEVILNQKCNRWDEIDLSFAKTVDKDWIETVNKDLFTRFNDIIVNSTGEGTLGRASLVKIDMHEGLLLDSHMLLLRVNEEKINPQLLVYLINSSFGQKQVELFKGAQATKQTELGVENVKKILLPLPDDLQIQNEIANNILLMRSQAEELKAKAVNLRLLAKKQFEEAIFDE